MLRKRGVKAGTGKLAHRIFGLGVFPHRKSRHVFGKASNMRIEREAPTVEGGAVLTTVENVNAVAPPVKPPTKAEVLKGIRDIMLPQKRKAGRQLTRIV